MKKELPLYPYISIEGYGLEDIEDYPGDWYADDSDFEGTICEIAEKKFTKAWRDLEYLLKNVNVNEIAIHLEILGYRNAAASYYPYMSNLKSGRFHFEISQNILYNYLSEKFDKDYKESDFTNMVIHHELIHMLDHKNITQFKYHGSSTDIREALIEYLLAYRQEGIAELYYLKKAKNRELSYNKAKMNFDEDVDRIMSLNWGEKDELSANKTKLLDSRVFYTVGFWMIIHALTCKNLPFYKEIDLNVIEKLYKGKRVKNDEMIKLIEIALKVDNSTFMEALYSQGGAEDQPFISNKKLQSLFSFLENIKHPRIIDQDDDEYNRVNADLIRFFNKSKARFL